MVKKIGGVFAFKVKNGPEGKEALWVVDVKNGKGSVSNDTGAPTHFTRGQGLSQFEYIVFVERGLNSVFRSALV